MIIQLGKQFLIEYAIFWLINLVFILLVLRGIYYLINKADPIKAIQIPLPILKSIKMDRKKKEEIRAQAMS